MVKRSHIGLNMHYIVITIVYSSASERLSSYALNRSIAQWDGANKTHLMDSPIDMCEVEQNLALNSSLSMIMVVHVKMDLMELPI